MYIPPESTLESIGTTHTKTAERERERGGSALLSDCLINDL